MAEKYLGQLTAKSAPATGDILVLEDSEDTKKIDYDALANAILNKLTTKTYTVAGGTNTLIAAIDALNSNIRHTFSNTTPLTSQLDVLASGTYTGLIGSYNHKDEVGMPANDNFFLQVYTNGSGYIDVLAYPVNNTDVYRKIKKGGTWVSDWEKQPTRAEIDALNSNIQVERNNVVSGGSASFVLNDKAVVRFHYGLLIGGSSEATAYVAFVFISNSAGNFGVKLVPILNVDSRTVTGTYNSTTGTVTFTPANTFYGGFRYIDLS